MTPISPVPRRLRPPGWFDLRLLLGLLLVLVSIAVGALVVSHADSTTAVLSTRRALAAGTVLTADDVQVSRVRVTLGMYEPGDAVLAGQSLNRAIGAGELIARSAMTAPDPADMTLTIPVKPQNAPDVQRGQRIVVWVSTQFCTTIVVGDIVVQDVRSAGSGALSAAGDESLVVRMSRTLAARTVTALGIDASTIRVVIRSGAADPSANENLSDLAACVAKRTS